MSSTMDFAMEKHGMLASDFFVFCQESVTAQERYGKYEDEDEHAEQSKLNHAGPEDARPFGGPRALLVSVEASKVITRMRRMEAIRPTTRKGSVMSVCEWMEIRTVWRISTSISTTSR